MQQMAQDDKGKRPPMCNDDNIRNTVPRKVRRVIPFLWAKHTSPTETHTQFIEVYGHGVLSVQHGRKLCKEFGNVRSNTVIVTAPVG
jgi:hypothetical protein